MSLLIDTDNLSKFDALCALAEHEMPYPVQTQVEQTGVALATEMLDLLLGTALEDHCEVIMEGFIGGLHSAANRIEREAGRAYDDLKRLTREFAGSEITSNQIEDATTKARRADAALAVAEMLRDAACEIYTTNTGNVWTPWVGSAKNSAATASMVEAREALRAREAAKLNLAAGKHVIVFRGAAKANTETDANRIFDALNAALAKYPDMQLATTGNYGAEQIALKWALPKVKAGIIPPVILEKVNHDKHGRSAPFKANEALMRLDPVHVFVLPKSLEDNDPENKGFGPVLNIADLARSKGIKPQAITAKAVSNTQADVKTPVEA